MIFAVLFGYLPFAIWLYILVGRSGFWRARERDNWREASQHLERWPSVVAVVPARNEADMIARSIGSLLAQEYPGPFRVVLVDDESDDSTAETARALDGSGRLAVISGARRPAGWTGKSWAVAQGVAHASDLHGPDYFWLTDADIVHAPQNLRRLVLRAEQENLVLVSFMAKLRCTSFAERFLIPAFVYLFQMLYPFGRVNDPSAQTAAAAGGCMLVQRAALETAGGIAGIRSSIIDDCALAKLMKAQGPIWLGLTERVISIRPYGAMRDIRRMVARSAYAELRYSPLLLAGALIGLMLMFIAPPLWTVFGEGAGQIAGVSAWALMTASFLPMLRFYGRSPLWGPALPLIGLTYAVFTLDSAIQHWRGRGGMWKGRAQAMAHG